MTTATPRTTPSKKMNLHFTFEFRNCLDLFSVPWSHNLLELHKYVTPAFNSTRKYEKLAAFVRVLQNTQNLVISRCCFAEDGKEMYKDLQRTCTAIVLFIKHFV